MLNIIVTKHAINRYISRILSDGEKVNITKIKEDLINIALNGQLITKKRMINEENSWKKVIQYDGITILVIEKNALLLLLHAWEIIPPINGTKLRN